MVTKFDSHTIRIRMYRVGFGDCFLVSLPCAKGNPEGDTHRHVLIDCGVHSRGNIEMIDQAVDHIAATTDGKLAVIIATHAHQDHISGFADAKFSKFQIGEVWLPWCENPKDKQATKLRRKQATVAAQLYDHFAADVYGTKRTTKLRAAAMSAVTNLVTNKRAMNSLRDGFKVNAEVRYLEAGTSLKNPAGIEGLSVNVLGPPRDQKFLARMDPPASQRYLRMNGNHSELVNPVRPIERKWRVDPKSGALGHLELSDDYRKKLMREISGDSYELLAFALDRAVNNTSLVTLFAFRGQTLLFPGDAQYGNWKFWLDQDDAEAILSSLNFLKVAHHGSHNATPKNALERMNSGNLAAMVSTQSVPWDSIPRLPLMKRLKQLTKQRVVRSDSLVLKSRPTAPKGPSLSKLPKGFQAGDFWYDYLIRL